MRAALALTVLAGAALGALLAGPGMPLGAARDEAPPPALLDAARALAAPFEVGDLPELLREDTPERRALERQCLTCHGWPLISGQRLTRPQWEATVAKMREKFHAPLTPLGAEEAMIVDLLSRALSPEAPPARPALLAAVTTATASAPSFAAITAPLLGADPAVGALRFARSCVVCHGKEALGGPVGPRLALRPVLADPALFHATVRDGRRAMPPHLDVGEAEAKDLLAHLRSLRGTE